MTDSINNRVNPRDCPDCGLSARGGVHHCPKPDSPNKLSREEIVRATQNGNTFFAQLAVQLLDSMRENERMLSSIKRISKLCDYESEIDEITHDVLYQNRNKDSLDK